VKVKNVVKLHVNIMKDQAGNIGTAATTAAAVIEDVKKMREIYAQIGLDVQLSNGGTPPEPDTSNPPNGAGLNMPGGNPSQDTWILDLDRANRRIYVDPSGEQRALLDDANLRTPSAGGKDDIEVYYINRFSMGGGAASFPSNALRPNGQGFANDQRYVNSIILATKMLVLDGSEGDRFYMILAHEVGHILEDRKQDSLTADVTHYPYTGLLPKPSEKTNLMVNGPYMIVSGKFIKRDMQGQPVFENGEPVLIDTNSGIFDSRRLTTGQEGTLNAHPELLHPA